MPLRQPYQPQQGHGQPEDDFFSWTMMAAASLLAPQQHQQRGISPSAEMIAGNTMANPSPPELFHGVKLRGLPFSATKDVVEAFLVSGNEESFTRPGRRTPRGNRAPTVLPPLSLGLAYRRPRKTQNSPSTPLSTSHTETEKKKKKNPPPFFRPRQSASTSSSSPAPTAPAARPSSSWEAAPRRCSRPSPGTGATSEGGTSRSSRPGAGSTTGPWRRRWRGATWQEREAPTSRCLPRARPSPPPPPPPPPPLSLSLSTQSCRDTHLQPFLLLLLLPQPLLCRSAHRCCSSSS